MALPLAHVRPVFVAGIIYVGGAVGVEHYSGADLNSLRYNMLTALEEGLEMTGVILAIYTTLDFISRNGDCFQDS